MIHKNKIKRMYKRYCIKAKKLKKVMKDVNWSCKLDDNK